MPKGPTIVAASYYRASSAWPLAFWRGIRDINTCLRRIFSSMTALPIEEHFAKIYLNSERRLWTFGFAEQAVRLRSRSRCKPAEAFQ